MMETEGNLWKAVWKKKGSKYHLSLVDHPKVKVSAEDIEDAVELLEEAIIDELDDAVPHLEWVSPLPTPIGCEGKDFVHVLAGHDKVDVENVDLLFERPQCASCKNFFGPRSKETIRLGREPKGDLNFTSFLGEIISRNMIEFLHLDSNAEFQLYPTILKGKETTEYMEVRATKGRDYVAKRGASSRWAFRCSECGISSVKYMPDEADYFKFISVFSLPIPLPDVFVLGLDHKVAIAVSSTLRQRIVRSKMLKNIVTDKVGVLSEEASVPFDKYFGGSK